MRAARYGPWVLLVVLTGCAPALVTTGEGLDALGRQFVAVGVHYNQLLDSRRITPEQYREWATFAREFQRVYPLAVDAWKTARLTEDAKAQQGLEAALGVLSARLTGLAVQAYEYAKGGGS